MHFSEFRFFRILFIIRNFLCQKNVSKASSEIEQESFLYVITPNKHIYIYICIYIKDVYAHYIYMTALYPTQVLITEVTRAEIVVGSTKY